MFMVMPIGLMAGSAPPPPTGPTYFFGENLTPGGVVVGDPVTAQASFLAALDTSTVVIWGLEDQSTGGIGGSNIDAYYDESGGPYPLTLIGAASVVGTATSGRFNTTPGGSQYMRLQQGQSIAFVSGIPSFPIIGPDLQAFGFFATDAGDFGGQLSVEINYIGGASETVDIPHTVSSDATNSGSLIFWGVITEAPVESFRIIGGFVGGSATTSDYFGIDDVVIATAGQVL